VTIQLVTKAPQENEPEEIKKLIKSPFFSVNYLNEEPSLLLVIFDDKQAVFANSTK
jgi:hypothetical protein